MNTFIQKYNPEIKGTLEGWDRIAIRGTIRTLCCVNGMARYLSRIGVLLKNFGDHVQAVTQCLIDLFTGVIEQQGRTIQYLPSSSVRKDELAREIAQRDGITEGTITGFAAVEPCRTFEIFRNRETKQLELRQKHGKCKFLYHYFIDKVFGFMSARIQTWFPFHVQFFMNGREWLARQMDRRGMAYVRDANCFPDMENFVLAQKLFDTMHNIDWPKELTRLRKFTHPAHESILGKLGLDYYWSAYQTEWASDIVFDSPEKLSALYPQLVRGAITTFGSEDVLRFLGRKQCKRFPEGEVMSDYGNRHEGIRIKHYAQGNSVKAYDKSGNILRIETTINNVNPFRSYRTPENTPDGEKAWRRMRRGVADMYRRSEVSQASNDRYTEALATLDTDEELGELLRKVCNPIRKSGKTYRGLRPFSQEDQALLTALADGEFVCHGICNGDLAKRLYDTDNLDAKERRKVSSRISYRLRILRGHGLIHKIPLQKRYQVSKKAQKIITSFLMLQHATIKQLNA